MFPNNQATLTETFQTALTAFVAGAQAIVNGRFDVNYPNQIPPTLQAQTGGKNVKIVNVKNGRVESVYCFVEIETGNVLKAAGFKAPAKGKRSCIFDADNGMSGIDCFGAIYKSTNGKLQAKIYV